MGSILANDAAFRKEFQQLIIDASEVSATAEGFSGVIRFVRGVYLMLTRGASEYNPIGSFSEDEQSSRTCLTRACEHDVFEFVTTRILQTATFQNDDEDLVFMYNAYLHKLMTSFLSQPAGREKDCSPRRGFNLNMQIREAMARGQMRHLVCAVGSSSFQLRKARVLFVCSSIRLQFHWRWSAFSGCGKSCSMITAAMSTENRGDQNDQETVVVSHESSSYQEGWRKL